MTFCAEIKSSLDGSRAFTLDGFKSITFDGIWFENFKSYVDGMHVASLVFFSRVFVLCADGFSGAVVLAMNSAVTIKNCYFVNNKALKLGRGSAIFGVNSNISIEHSVFSNHVSKGNGGTIYASRKSNVDILGSIFEGKILCFEHHTCVRGSFGLLFSVFLEPNVVLVALRTFHYMHAFFLNLGCRFSL